MSTTQEIGFEEPRAEDIFIQPDSSYASVTSRSRRVQKKKKDAQLMPNCALIDENQPINKSNNAYRNPTVAYRTREKEVYNPPEGKYCFTTGGGLPLWFNEEEQPCHEIVMTSQIPVPITTFLTKHLCFCEQKFVLGYRTVGLVLGALIRSVVDSKYLGIPFRIAKRSLNYGSKQLKKLMLKHWKK